MPRYRYKCKKCEFDFEVVHAMSEKLADCEKCKSKDSLQRVPFIVRTKKEGNSKTGDIVNKFIKDTKRDLDEEKRNLSKEYVP